MCTRLLYKKYIHQKKEFWTTKGRFAGEELGLIRPAKQSPRPLEFWISTGSGISQLRRKFSFEFGAGLLELDCSPVI
jgi:hypothetical protein